MIIGCHFVLTGYGHWLPNDPRGSMSAQVHDPDLAKLGPLHYGRKEVQPSRGELRDFHRKAGPLLHFPVLWWEAPQRQALAGAFGRVVNGNRLTCYAAAFLACHIHILTRRHRLTIDQVDTLLRQAGREALLDDDLAPPDHPVFSADVCRYYKDTPEKMRACVEYIQSNYAKHRIPPPHCPWITTYDNWGAST